MGSKLPFDRGARADGVNGNASESEFDPESDLKSQSLGIEIEFELKA